MAERIADIWRAGHGVIPVPVISKLCDEDIKCREAALINLKRAGQSIFTGFVRFSPYSRAHESREHG